MKKVLAGILIFDMLLGILCLSVGTERYAEQKSYGTYIETEHRRVRDIRRTEKDRADL